MKWLFAKADHAARKLAEWVLAADTPVERLFLGAALGSALGASLLAGLLLGAACGVGVLRACLALGVPGL